MSNVINLQSSDTSFRYFGPARVVEAGSESGQLLVELETEKESHQWWARNALPGGTMLQADDKVLVSGETRDALYVIGMLEQQEKIVRLEIDAGAYAELSVNGGTKSVRIFSADDELLFEYQPSSGNAKLIMDSKSLEIQNRCGDMKFKTAGEMSLDARAIRLEGQNAVHLGQGRRDGQSGASISLARRSLRMEGEEARLSAQYGDLRIAEMLYTGKRLLGKVAYVRLLAGRLETVARTVMSSAENVYQKVEQLAQLQAGRVRSLVRSSWHIKARDTIMKAEKDYKVNAEKIHPG